MRRWWAWSSTVGSHSPSRLSAVRSRWAERCRSSASSKLAAFALPSGAVHSMNPLMRGNHTGRTTRRSLERVVVAVLVVGTRLVEVVVDERDGVRVAAERRAGDGEATGRRLERNPDRGAPRLLVARMVQLVEDHEAALRVLAQGPGVGGHLLVGDDDPVHVVGAGDRWPRTTGARAAGRSGRRRGSTAA